MKRLFLWLCLFMVGEVAGAGAVLIPLLPQQPP